MKKGCYSHVILDKGIILKKEALKTHFCKRNKTFTISVEKSIATFIDDESSTCILPCTIVNEISSIRHYVL